MFDGDDLAIRPPLHDKLAWNSNHVDWSVIDVGPLQDVSISRRGIPTDDTTRACEPPIQMMVCHRCRSIHPNTVPMAMAPNPMLAPLARETATVSSWVGVNAVDPSMAHGMVIVVIDGNWPDTTVMAPDAWAWPPIWMP
jgi:hypothetical protein